MTYEELANQAPDSVAESSGPRPLTEANLSAMNRSKEAWSDRSCTCPPDKTANKRKQVKMDIDMK